MVLSLEVISSSDLDRPARVTAWRLLHGKLFVGAFQRHIHRGNAASPLVPSWHMSAAARHHHACLHDMSYSSSSVAVVCQYLGSHHSWAPHCDQRQIFSSQTIDAEAGIHQPTFFPCGIASACSSSASFGQPTAQVTSSQDHTSVQRTSPGAVSLAAARALMRRDWLLVVTDLRQ